MAKIGLVDTDTGARVDPDITYVAGSEVGTGANQIPRLDAQGKLPPIDASNLINVDQNKELDITNITNPSVIRTGSADQIGLVVQGDAKYGDVFVKGVTGDPTVNFLAWRDYNDTTQTEWQACTYTFNLRTIAPTGGFNGGTIHDIFIVRGTEWVAMVARKTGSSSYSYSLLSSLNGKIWNLVDENLIGTGTGVAKPFFLTWVGNRKYAWVHDVTNIAIIDLDTYVTGSGITWKGFSSVSGGTKVPNLYSITFENYQYTQPIKFIEGKLYRPCVIEAPAWYYHPGVIVSDDLGDTWMVFAGGTSLFPFLPYISTSSSNVHPGDIIKLGSRWVMSFYLPFGPELLNIHTLAVSDDDGSTWVINQDGSYNARIDPFHQIITHNGTPTIVGWNGSSLVSSTDGLNWTNRHNRGVTGFVASENIAHVIGNGNAYSTTPDLLADFTNGAPPEFIDGFTPVIMHKGYDIYDDPEREQPITGGQDEDLHQFQDYEGNVLARIKGDGTFSGPVESPNVVIPPIANTANYIPQWNGADSKTLKDGLAVPDGGLAGLTALNSLTDNTPESITSSVDLSLVALTKKLIEADSASSIALTIKAQTDVAYLANSMTNILNINSGDVVITTSSGVLLNGVDEGTVTVAAGQIAFLKRIAEDEWMVPSAVGGGGSPADDTYDGTNALTAKILYGGI